MKVLFKMLVLLLISQPILARGVKTFNEGWAFKKGPFATDPILFSPTMGGKWSAVKIPHTWNAKDMQNDKNNYYAGEAYYRKNFKAPDSLNDKRIFLRFEGVGSVADVYVNGTYAGNHKGGYSAFAVELTKLLKPGQDNEILVKVDNTPRPDVIPINNTLFGVYGGIYRPVELITTDKVNIAVTDNASPGIYISQENVSSKSADINIKTKLDNKYKEAKNITLVATISDMNGKEVQKQKRQINLLPQGRQNFDMKFSLKNPHLWQGLEDPYLYKVTVQVEMNGKTIDSIEQPLGVRNFELKAGDGMYLNGKKTPMYGVCRHQDWLDYGSALSNEQHDKDLEIIKELGATTIRLAHYQQSDYFYSKCDSLGLMVWAEIPFVNRVSTQEGDNAKTQLMELIRQNYNHPSIYTWGLHNEVYTPINYTAALTAELDDLAKSEDPYRYTVSVNGYGDPGHGVNMNADIQGINRYFGWYEKKIQDMEPWIESLEKDYPGYKLMLAEYGTEANLDHQQEVVGDVGDCCGFDKKYNETFATRFHEQQWGYIEKHPQLLASYLWNTFDFATPASSQGGVEARNMKGLVTFDRKTKKDPYYWYKANWSKEPVLYLTQRRVVNRENKITPVTVYSNMGDPVLFVNGVEYTDFKKGTTDVHYIFEGVELQNGTNVVETKLKDKNSAKAKGKKGISELSDKVVWNYDPELKGKTDKDTPKVKEGEHIGL